MNNILIRSIAVYLAYQTKGNSIALLGLGTNSLSSGLAIGSIVSLIALGVGITPEQFIIVNLFFAICAIVATVLVFPEKRFRETLTPLEELQPVSKIPDLRQLRRARFMESCEQVARSGGLSARETEVLKLLAKRMSAQEIADELVISVNTVRAHIRSIHRKLDASSNEEIITRINQIFEAEGK